MLLALPEPSTLQHAIPSGIAQRVTPRRTVHSASATARRYCSRSGNQEHAAIVAVGRGTQIVRKEPDSGLPETRPLLAR